MSRDLGRDVPDLEKLYARKLRADFSYPKFSEDFWVFLSFLSDRSVFSTLWQKVLKVLRSLGKERKKAKKHFSGEGGGGVYSEPPTRQEFYTPPPFLYAPPAPRRVFSGVGGWGCIKFGPVGGIVACDGAKQGCTWCKRLLGDLSHCGSKRPSSEIR